MTFTGEIDGPRLAAALGGVVASGRETDVVRALVASAVSARSMIDALEAVEAQALAFAADIAELQATRAGSLKASEREMPLRSIAAEFAAALRVSDRTMQGRMKGAQDLIARFPETYNAWAEGHISRRHAAVIQDDERHADARTLRRVRVIDLPDGMAELQALLPATLAYGIEDRLTQQAKAVIRARTQPVTSPADPGALLPDETAPADPDTRSIDEVRADLLADLLLCGDPVAPDGHRGGLGAITATVRVTVPVLTAAGVGADPAGLVGHGPVDRDTARTLLGGASSWERVMTSPVTGAVLAVDRYEPNTDLRRYLDARDEHCRFLGCRMPARRCDRDHTKEAARGGPTCVCNFEHLCEGHHMLRHHTAWSVRQLGGGLLEWTSPLGHVYIDRPDATVRFVPDGADPPGYDPLPGIADTGRGDGLRVSWPPPPDACPHTTTPRNPLLDPWLIAHEGPPPPF